MSKSLNIIFIVHLIIALLFGAPLLLIPGRFLGLFGWQPIDPHITRLLGAALLALAWSSFLGYRTTDSNLRQAFVQIDLIFCALGAVGLLRHLLIAAYPWYFWMIFLILAVFAIVWFYFLIKKPT
jgi:hypothetical protein